MRRRLLSPGPAAGRGRRTEPRALLLGALLPAVLTVAPARTLRAQEPPAAGPPLSGADYDELLDTAGPAAGREAEETEPETRGPGPREPGRQEPGLRPSGRREPGEGDGGAAAGTPAATGAPEDPVDWELDLAQSGYQINKTSANFARLLTAREKVVKKRCMGDLFRTLAYKGSPADPACLEAVRGLTALDPDNAVATCAVDGIDAPSCLAAYDRVLVKDRGSVGGTSGQLLDDKLAADRTAQQVRRTEDESYALRRIITGSTSAEDRPKRDAARAKLVALYEKTVKTTCASDDSAVGPVPTPRPASSSGGLFDPATLDLRLGRGKPTPAPARRFAAPTPAGPLSKSKPTPTPVPTPFARIRTVSAPCLKFANLLLGVDAQNAVGICGKFGNYHPRCIAAARLFRARARTTPTPPPGSTPPPPGKNDGGLATF